MHHRRYGVVAAAVAGRPDCPHHAQRPQQPAEHTVTVRGTLRGLHLDQDWLEVVPVGGDPLKPIHIEDAADVLDDVIGPLVNHLVVVTAIQRKNRLSYQDIEADE